MNTCNILSNVQPHLKPLTVLLHWVTSLTITENTGSQPGTFTHVEFCMSLSLHLRLAAPLTKLHFYMKKSRAACPDLNLNVSSKAEDICNKLDTGLLWIYMCSFQWTLINRGARISLKKVLTAYDLSTRSWSVLRITLMKHVFKKVLYVYETRQIYLMVDLGSVFFEKTM